MSKTYVTLASIWTWLVLGSCIALWLPLMSIIWLATWPFDRERYWVGLFFRKIAVVTATLNPLWHFRVTGTMPENPRRPYVVVSNHESFTDILLISHLPWEMKWLSKIELLRIPVLGWIMRIAGDIPVERGTRSSAAKAMRRCLEVLKGRMSIIIFPEGTRSTTGELLPFKDGAFRLAIDAGVPILPLVVRGTSTALRKHDWRVGPSDAEVRVLTPVDTTGLGHKDIPALKERVRNLIQETRRGMEGAAPPCSLQGWYSHADDRGPVPLP